MKKILIFLFFFLYCAEGKKIEEEFFEISDDIKVLEKIEVIEDLLEEKVLTEEKFEEIEEEIFEKFEEEIIEEIPETKDTIEFEEKTEDFCTDDKHCDDKNPCTEEKCDKKTKKCLYQALKCESLHSCVKGECEQGNGGCIYKIISEKECENFSTIYEENFEKGNISGFFIENLAKNTKEGEGEEEAIWQISTKRKYSGNYSMYFGILSKGNYDNGKIVAASLTSPPITITQKGASKLIFYLYMDVEEGNAWDVLLVNAKTNGKIIPLWFKGYDFSLKKWQVLEINLNAMEEKTFQIEFIFNSIDKTYNNYEGVYIDDIFIISKESEIKCESNEECDDKIACTDEECKNGRCEYTLSFNCCFSDVQCDDLNFCTIDTCKNSICENIKVADPLCCNKNIDCDDKNECTVDTCKNNKCVYTKSSLPGCCEKDIECDDFDTCTIDKCMEKQCVHINICCYKDEDCDDGDDVCTKDYCKDKKCVFEPTGKPGCCNPEIAVFNFDSYEEWNFTNTDPVVGWQIVQGMKYTSAPGSLYYGNPKTKNFDSGETNSGTATSEFINLPKGYPVKLSFEIYMDTETIPFFDKFFVNIATGEPKEATVWDKLKLMDYKKFINQKVDLTPWVGKTIQLKFVFDTVDSLFNSGEGIYIDDIKITTTCIPL